MTLPNLIADYRQKQFVTAAKKSYSTALNAVNRWNADNGTIGDYFYFFTAGTSDYEILKSLSKYLNIVQICDSSNIDSCGGKYTVKQYKKLNDGSGNTRQAYELSESRAVLADGTFIAIYSEALRYGGSCKKQFWANEKDENGYFIPDPSSPTGHKGYYTGNNVCGWIFFDTNGLKGPNQVGIDYFGFAFDQDKDIIGYSDDTRGNLNYVLANDKLIKTENYTPGKYE